MDIIQTQRSWIEINLDALKHNVNELTQLITKEQLMAVIKADAYGHGALMIARTLESIGITSFAVATLDEAIELRQHNIHGLILILGYTAPHLAYLLEKYQLTQTIIDYSYARLLNQTGHHVQVHIKVDSGMHRIGEDYHDLTHITSIYRLPYLEITGIFSHLCVADSLTQEDCLFTETQFSHFNLLLKQLKKAQLPIGKAHIQSSYGLLNYPFHHYDFARIGIALYGVTSSYHEQYTAQLQLQPVLSLRSRIIHIQTYHQGETIGYGRTYQLKRESRIAVIPIGYADGLPRNLSNQQNVLIHGYQAPIIGRICMDQLMIDVTDISEIQINDLVTLIGQDQQATLTVEDMAQHAQTITNEILSRIGKRLPKIYYQEGQFIHENI